MKNTAEEYAEKLENLSTGNDPEDAENTDEPEDKPVEEKAAERIARKKISYDDFPDNKVPKGASGKKHL